ncbi:hypothetical protein LLEC1_07562 [Akanthomyces lecanii]|uniref:Uncharacterized protein n=1 Tax=Cordyceps confragosa TaxID=2714763 RepID=A0A179IDH9_CORDF|nr:hypothetical protein LLEC1_07562 [Akanthomyces lecanii]
MPRTLELVGRRPISIESALDEKRNVVNWASYAVATDAFYKELWEQREVIGALVKDHLALGKRDVCSVLPPSQWIRGSLLKQGILAA